MCRTLSLWRQKSTHRQKLALAMYIVGLIIDIALPLNRTQSLPFLSSNVGQCSQLVNGACLIPISFSPMRGLGLLDPLLLSARAPLNGAWLLQLRASSDFAPSPVLRVLSCHFELALSARRGSYPSVPSLWVYDLRALSVRLTPCAHDSPLRNSHHLASNPVVPRGQASTQSELLINMARPIAYFALMHPGQIGHRGLTAT